MTFSNSTAGLHLRTILNAIPQMVWSTRADGFHDFFNDRWYEFTGVPYGSTDGAGWNGMFHPDDQDRAWERWRHCLASGVPYEIEYRLRHHTGAYRWTLGRALPARDADGVIERWFGTCTDIDDLKQAQSQRNKLAAIVEHARDFVGMADPDGRVEYVNRAGRRMMGLGENDDIGGTRVSDYFTPESREMMRSLGLPKLAEMEYWEGELDFQPFPGGSPIPVLYNIFPLLDREEGLIGYGTVSHDLRERRRFEEARELIARELSHRIKNIFSVVGSLIGMSARHEPAARPFAEKVRARIDALAQAHEYVRPHSPASRPNVEGETVHGLLGLLLRPYREETGDRIRVSGPDCAVGVTSATALALVVHELATNAIKYGALSSPDGEVTIRTDLSDSRFGLTWREQGGPEIEVAPARTGFGSVLSERVAVTQLGADIRHEWLREGLYVHLVTDAARLRR